MVVGFIVISGGLSLAVLPWRSCSVVSRGGGASDTDGIVAKQGPTFVKFKVESLVRLVPLFARAG